MIFTEEEKISMLKAMDELIRSDDDIHDKEVEFLEAIVQEFDWDSGFLEKLENFKMEDAVAAVKSLSPEKMDYFQTLLNELAHSDKIINEKEIEFIERVNQFISDNSV